MSVRSFVRWLLSRTATRNSSLLKGVLLCEAPPAMTTTTTTPECKRGDFFFFLRHSRRAPGEKGEKAERKKQKSIKRACSNGIGGTEAIPSEDAKGGEASDGLIGKVLGSKEQSCGEQQQQQHRSDLCGLQRQGEALRGPERDGLVAQERLPAQQAPSSQRRRRRYKTETDNSH